jgi:hypothetical protein
MYSDDYRILALVGSLLAVDGSLEGSEKRLACHSAGITVFGSMTTSYH